MLLASFEINHKQVFELLLTGNNTKNTEMQRKYRRYSIFIENVNVSKNMERKYKLFKIFCKLYKVLSTCAKSQAFGILSSRNKVRGNFTA